MLSKSPIVAALATVAVANTVHPLSFMTGDSMNPALWAAPQWNFPTGTCLPSTASINGGQNPGNAPDNCNIHKLDHNCPSAPQWNGANTPMWSFPTYYDHQRCTATEYRTAYNVYFTKDTAHRHDIEWVIVVWGSNDGGKTFYRNRMIFQQDNHNPSKQWGDIQNTFDNQSDQLSLGTQFQNHARVFVGKFHHPMLDDRYTGFKNTCPPESKDDFRTDDFYFWSNENLVHVDTIPGDWNFSPAAFARGQGICNF